MERERLPPHDLPHERAYGWNVDRERPCIVGRRGRDRREARRGLVFPVPSWSVFCPSFSLGERQEEDLKKNALRIPPSDVPDPHRPRDELVLVREAPVGEELDRRRLFPPLRVLLGGGREGGEEVGVPESGAVRAEEDLFVLYPRSKTGNKLSWGRRWGC